jgi:hypothetical protein
MHDNLDGGGGRRSREHTELLVTELELGILWDEYGLVGNIIVSIDFSPDGYLLQIHYLAALHE